MYSDPSFVLDLPAPGARAFWYARFAKRPLDILFVLVLTPVALPLVLLSALLLRAQGQRAFFAHARVGRDGVVFRCLKLQTMVPDAAAVLRRHLRSDPAAAEEWLSHRKLRRDPRITRLGRILRATSMDELPQLWNVLLGQMSVIGPRPITAEELRGYGPRAAAYMRMPPGITGLWQVRGRKQLGMEARIACDVEYAEAPSLWQDGMILLRTVPAVLAGGQ